MAEQGSLSLQIKKSPLDRQAAAVIRERVLSGEFPPGHRLVETWLSEQLGLSRGTVRAALSELVHEGLVEQIAYTRWAVPALSARDAWELYTLRSALEGLAAGLVAAQLTEHSATLIRNAFQAIKDAAHEGHRAELADRDAGLHKLIIELSGHQRLIRQYTVIEQQTRRYIACSNALTVDAEGIVAQHEPIVAAVLAGRSDLAEQEMKRHNYEEGALLVDQLRRNEATAASDGKPVTWPEPIEVPAVVAERVDEPLIKTAAAPAARKKSGRAAVRAST
ncbi:GntR family transcriptional regulator [soil metagenome]